MNLYRPHSHAFPNPVPYIKPDYIPRTATTFTLRGFIESPVSTGKGDY